MYSFFKWTVRVVTGLLILAAVGIGFTYYLAARSLPDYDANRPARGITAPLEIVRDHSNVPHIFGTNDEDVFFGLGYAHAQDRLWQMVMMRRTAQGRLSEVFGERTLKVDELIRRLDIYTLAQVAVAQQDDDTRTALEAYARGVNAWLDRVNQEALGRGAPEFFMFSNDISPWVPADSIAILKLMGVKMATHLQREVLRAQVALTAGEDKLNDLMPDAPGTGVAALPNYAALFGAHDTDFAALAPRPAEDPLSPVAPLDFGGASNAWAAAPSRSAAGGTLLANDPHLDFSAPGIWYLARLELQSGGVIGGSIPGMPLILLGRSQGFGWGLTSSYLDDQDVFIEKLNPKNPTEVLTSDGYAPMQTRATIIKVKDKPPVTIELKWTENGPVLPGDQYGLGNVTPPGHVTAIGWTLLAARDRSMTAAFHLMQAKSVEDGIAAGKDFVAPSQNVTMVDAEHIAMKTFGAMPRRDANHMTQGRMPAPGWKAENRWLGIEAYDANPEFVDPTGGIVGNTNNKLLERPFPLHVSWDWGDTQRVQRWQKLMQNREVHTRESFIEAQLDTVSVTARNLLPLVGADLWYTGEPAAEGTPERKRQRALDLLANWNGEMNEHMPEPLVYMAWMRALQQRLIRDDLGPLASAFPHVDPVFIERVFRNVDGASKWCDVVQSAPVETCPEIAKLALDDALLWIDEHVGGQAEALRWGDMHLATHDHAVLGKVPVLKWFVNIRQSTSGGDNTLNRGLTSGSGADPFLNVHGPGYRGVYDFADPDSSLFVSATGQSGHFLSRHYDDLGELWRRGEFVPMSLDPALARAAAVGITHLIPAP